MPPHQHGARGPLEPLQVGFPADRFKPRPIDELGLRLPPALCSQRTAPVVPEPPMLPVPRPPLEEPIVMSANGIVPMT
jgi:hypothetical protein